MTDNYGSSDAEQEEFDIEAPSNRVEDSDYEEEYEQSDYLDAAREAFSSSNEYFNANIRRNLENSVRQFHSLHAHRSKYHSELYKYKHKLFKPKSRSAVRKHEAALAAALFSTNDVVNIEPVDQDSVTQVDSSSFYKELMNHRLKKTIPWFQTVMGAYQDAMVYGTVISKQSWNFDRNEPEIAIIPPENFRFDPGCNWVDPIGTSPYIIEMIPMFVYQVRNRIDNDGWNDVSNSELKSATKHSYDSIRVTREKDRLDPKDRPNSVSDHDIVWVHLNIINIGEGDMVFYTLGPDVLLTDPEPLEDVFFSGRPYVSGKCVVETHRNYSSGLMELTKNIQEESNEILNQRLDNVSLNLDTRIFLKRGQQVDIDSIQRNRPGGVVFLNDPKNDVNFARPGDVTSSSYQEVNYLNIDFDSLVGGFDGGSVQSNRSLNETVGGMNMISSAANQVTEYQIKTFIETWVEPVLMQILRLEQKYETDQMVIGLAGKKAGVVQRYKTADDIVKFLMDEDLSLTVSVGMGATNPATHIEKFMMAIGNLTKIDPSIPSKLNMKEVSKEVFGKLGYADGQRFLNFGEDEDPRIAEMQQQIQQLQAKLEQKKPDEMWKAEADLKRAQAVKTGVEAAFAAMQGGEIVATLPAVAPIADGIMASAGYVQQGGDDPNFQHPQISAEVLSEARKQALEFRMEQNNNPLTPKPPSSGVKGSKSSIEGGDNS